MPFDFNSDDTFSSQILTDIGGDPVDDLVTVQDDDIFNSDDTFSSQILTDDYTIPSGDLTNPIVEDYNGDGKDGFILP